MNPGLSRRELLALPGLVPAAALAPAIGFAPRGLLAALETMAARGGRDDDVARDEAFWGVVQRAFTCDRTIINLNNGGVFPAPAMVQEAMKRHLDFANLAPAYTMWRVQEPGRENVRRHLAQAFGVGAEEVAITRNASESLETCQLGIDLRRGDEVLTTTLDYPRMLDTFDQRARREGIAVRRITIPTPCEDPAEIVRRFAAAITERTRMILVSQVVFLTGNVLPVREVVALGRQRGIPVIVDGAHALAHLDFKIGDLGCDYFGASLHKWLFAPHGTGLLYVRRDRIKDLWPLMPADDSLADDVRKFEQIGTHPAANALAIAEALTFHETMGASRKLARLLYLRELWTRRLLRSERVRFLTSLKPGLSGGIVLMQIAGLDAQNLAHWLWEQHRIFVVPIVHEEFEGVRVTPSVHTTVSELERFCEAMEDAMEKGVPEPRPASRKAPKKR